MKEIEWGKQKFIVDFDDDFIQYSHCEGKDCSKCNTSTECYEELSFVYDQLKGDNEC